MVTDAPLAHTHVTQGDSAGIDRATSEPSASSALVHLVAGSEGVITKRIALALLEGQQLLAHSVARAALVVVGMILAAAAWFAGAAVFVLIVAPDARPVVQLAAFGLVNGACAAALIAVAMRRGEHRRRSARTAASVAQSREPLPVVGKS